MAGAFRADSVRLWVFYVVRGALPMGRTPAARGRTGRNAPSARGWDPASPARFIEWFLCSCIDTGDDQQQGVACRSVGRYVDADLCSSWMHCGPIVATFT